MEDIPDRQHRLSGLPALPGRSDQVSVPQPVGHAQAELTPACQHVAPCSVLRVAHRMLRVAHRVLRVAHRVLRVAHRVLRVAHRVLRVAHNVLRVAHRVLRVAHCVLRVAHRVLRVAHRVCSVSSPTLFVLCAAVCSG